MRCNKANYRNFFYIDCDETTLLALTAANQAKYVR